MSADLVGVLLRAEADRLSVGVTPPPLDLLARRGSRRLMPVAAAAAVVLVAGAAFAATQSFRQDRGPVPITQFGSVVPYDKDAPSAKFGDVPPPIQVLTGRGGDQPIPYANDGNPLCKGSDVAATLDLASGEDAGRLKLRWTRQTKDFITCRLHDDAPKVVLYDASGAELAQSTYTTQPPVTNPPAVGPRYLFDKGRETAFTWTSNCGGPAVRAEVSGLTSESFRADVTGVQPTCDGRTSAPRLGLFGGDEVAPADREGLQVRLTAPASVPAGTIVRLVAEVANPTREPISLTPCPTWLFEQAEARVGSGGRSTRMPCDQLPTSLASGSAVRFEIEERLSNVTPDVRGVLPLKLRFGIAGTKPWEGSVDIDHGTPNEPVATVPWKDTPKPPGEAMTAPPAIGTKFPLASLHPTIEGLPESVRRGETMHYWVRVTDMATGGEPTSLDPCPGFVQFLQWGRAHPAVEDEHYVNCAAAPAGIAHGTSIRLDMELTIPSDAPLGSTSLTWKLGKLDFSGSESAMATFVIT
jgi:hypothetical protein